MRKWRAIFLHFHEITQQNPIALTLAVFLHFLFPDVAGAVATLRQGHTMKKEHLRPINRMSLRRILASDDSRYFCSYKSS